MRNSPSPPPRGVARRPVRLPVVQLQGPDGTGGTPDTKHPSPGPTVPRPHSQAGAQSTSPDEAPAVDPG
eukprot:1602816-Rhodomonas_salina.1